MFIVVKEAGVEFWQKEKQDGKSWETELKNV